MRKGIEHFSVDNSEREKKSRYLALVSGGSRGIGRAITESLITDYENNVVICGRSEDSLNKAKEQLPDLTTEQVDVSDPAEAHGFVARAAENLGGLDTLVLNAAITGVEQYPNDTDQEFAERYSKVIDTNAAGAIAMIQAAKPHLKEAGGTIVFLTSRFAKSETPHPDAEAYAKSKKMVEQYLAKFVADKGNEGIFAFSVDPGAVDTDLRNSIIEHGPISLASLAKKEKDAGLLVSPEAVGKIIAKMSSDHRKWNPETCEYDLPITNGERIEIFRPQIEQELKN